MAQIAHIHWQFNQMGGGEYVALNIIESLQNNHDITLITDTSINFSEFNNHFGTNVEPINVQIPRCAGIEPKVLLSFMRDRINNGPFGMLQPLPLILVNKLVQPYLRDVDLVINTTSEMVTNKITIQYVHYPLYNRYENPYYSPPENIFFSQLNNILLYLAGLNSIPDNHYILTNSQWTSDLLKTMYDIQPKVVYPPINISDFNNPQPLKNRENGFVILGRITRGKNILQAIEIIKGVRLKGHDVHLHIIGPTSDEKYSSEVKEMAAKYPFILFEGKMPRNDLIEILETHRYGIHTKQHEHFGVAVAEIIAAGALPFVHNTGGQREIVNKQDGLMYTNTTDAINKIDSVLSESDLEEALRKGLPDINERYSVEQFRREINTIVSSILNKNNIDS